MSFRSPQRSREHCEDSHEDKGWGDNKEKKGRSGLTLGGREHSIRGGREHCRQLVVDVYDGCVGEGAHEADYSQLAPWNHLTSCVGINRRRLEVNSSRRC